MPKNSLLSAHQVLRGSLYWIAPDPLKDSVQHPHVVLQDDIFNASRIPTTIICALSTNLQKATEPGNVLLDEAEAGLPRRSVIVVSQLSVVDKLALQNYIGILASGRVDQVLTGLRFQQAGFLYGR